MIPAYVFILADSLSGTPARNPSQKPDQRFKATLIKWRNRHDTCLRADRGALTQMDWPSFKAAQQRAARRQVSPNQLFFIETGGIQKVRQPHRAARQGNQPSLRHSARLANLLNAMTVMPLDQRCLNQSRSGAVRSGLGLFSARSGEL
ncbi:MAG TPA: hypothetical protein VFN25_14180 [Dokdonella sp.]|uniref:hypothetical protein n=1 Tax=Dokdonella sp. TaxID=2291710 RepID=UPI002D7E33B6|nr:hypothetical protein [Dokdonella sp.]HET9034037.1 hypothetical protein [Dokdonella sp.]